MEEKGSDGCWGLQKRCEVVVVQCSNDSLLSDGKENNELIKVFSDKA